MSEATPVSPLASASGVKFCGIGVPSGFVPITRYGRISTTPVPSGSLRSSSCSPMSVPGTPWIPYGEPAAASVSGTAPSHSGAPVASRTTRYGAGPKPFWWNV